ncbi:MAG: hypothetical protein QNJ04_06860 [Desulfobacterales bacterium]|nr:hypothetical protein [Desulfobacterales bacterium]
MMTHDNNPYRVGAGTGKNMPVGAQSAASFLPVAGAMIGRIARHQAFSEAIRDFSIASTPESGYLI